jgi:ACT domain-containing protein
MENREHGNILGVTLFALLAVHRLINTGQRVSIAAVSRMSGVSRSTLYRYPGLIGFIRWLESQFPEKI